MAEVKFGDPEILTLCIAVRILPRSLVIVIFTSGLFQQSASGARRYLYIAPASVMTPTVLSGFDCIFAVKIMLTASDSAPNRVGVKSPFLVCSELSTLEH
jgi:hypothetical protein